MAIYELAHLGALFKIGTTEEGYRFCIQRLDRVVSFLLLNSLIDLALWYISLLLRSAINKKFGNFSSVRIFSLI